MNLNEVLLTAVFLSMCTGGCSGCEKKPKDCSTDLITFNLFNSKNPNGIQLSNDGNDVQMFTDGEMKFIFHGYKGSTMNENMVRLRAAYVKNPNYSSLNILHVDYTKLATCYWTLIQSLNIIGRCAAEFIKNKIINNNISIDRLHVIGFSFGAHAAAVTSEKIRSVAVFRRLTGLDPALPAFTFPFPGSWHKLNRSHAKFVDVIHTNSGWRGVYSSNAHLDIYGNSGMEQDGCGWTDSLCSHTRALEYFTESVNSEFGFYAVKCGRLSIFFGRCKFEPSGKTKMIIVGEPCTPPEKQDEGSYFFPTRPQPPFAVGQPQPRPPANKPN